jgi:hypothetical protein
MVHWEIKQVLKTETCPILFHQVSKQLSRIQSWNIVVLIFRRRPNKNYLSLLTFAQNSITWCCYLNQATADGAVGWDKWNRETWPSFCILSDAIIAIAAMFKCLSHEPMTTVNQLWIKKQELFLFVQVVNTFPSFALVFLLYTFSFI